MAPALTVRKSRESAHETAATMTELRTDEPCKDPAVATPREEVGGPKEATGQQLQSSQAWKAQVWAGGTGRTDTATDPPAGSAPGVVAAAPMGCKSMEVARAGLVQSPAHFSQASQWLKASVTGEGQKTLPPLEPRQGCSASGKSGNESCLHTGRGEPPHRPSTSTIQSSDTETCPRQPQDRV